MNSLFALLDLAAWKPVLTALLLPPVPLLLLVLIGARLVLPRRGLGWGVILVSVALLWLSACAGTGHWLTRTLLRPPPALSAERISALKALAQARAPLAIVVLGGGAEPMAPEYHLSNLQQASIERLRYGLWLARETGLPVAFSGGVGWGQQDSLAEARVAARIAAQEFGRPLRWVEDRSRDTHENGANTVALLKPDGIRHVLLVTHHWHMNRSVRAFERAAAGAMRIEPAPMGLATDVQRPLLAWLPSSQGFMRVRNVLHELAGLALGA